MFLVRSERLTILSSEPRPGYDPGGVSFMTRAAEDDVFGTSIISYWARNMSRGWLVLAERKQKTSGAALCYDRRKGKGE